MSLKKIKIEGIVENGQIVCLKAAKRLISDIDKLIKKEENRILQEKLDKNQMKLKLD